MKTIDFPQAIVDVHHVTSFKFEYADGTLVSRMLSDVDSLLNDTIREGECIAVIVDDETFYYGRFCSIEDDHGTIVVKLRSIISPSCVISIPTDHIIGWCILPILNSDEC